MTRNDARRAGRASPSLARPLPSPVAGPASIGIGRMRPGFGCSPAPQLAAQRRASWLPPEACEPLAIPRSSLTPGRRNHVPSIEILRLIEENRKNQTCDLKRRGGLYRFFWSGLGQKQPGPSTPITTLISPGPRSIKGTSDRPHFPPRWQIRSKSSPWVRDSLDRKVNARSPQAAIQAGTIRPKAQQRRRVVDPGRCGAREIRRRAGRTSS